MGLAPCGSAGDGQDISTVLTPPPAAAAAAAVMLAPGDDGSLPVEDVAVERRYFNEKAPCDWRRPRALDVHTLNEY